jgi:hypothetical protein
VGKETKDDPLKDFLAVNGNGAGHEGYNPARYTSMTMIVSYQM